MELSRFIHENNINNYETLKSILETEPYNLKIKEDIDQPQLFLIHTQNNSNFNIPLVNECNGIILEKNTFKIICYTFNKCSDSLSFDNKLNVSDLYFESAIEGTHVRLFYYNNKWQLSTKKCIDAAKSKWISDKNFLQLFEECVERYDFMQKLNTTYCYSFIIMHPENNIVVNYTTPNVLHVSTRDLNTLNEVNVHIGIPTNERKFIMSDNIESIINNLYVDTSLLYEGIMFIDINYNRWKIKSPYFNKIRNLWGNTNNRFYRFLELRQDCNLLQEYLNYYSYDRVKFISYEEQIKNMANDILKIYLSKHVHKNGIKIPFFFSKIIYKLHGDFFKDKIKTDYNKIMMTLLELEPRNVCFIFNNYEKYKAELNKNDNSEMEISYA